MNAIPQFLVKGLLSSFQSLERAGGPTILPLGPTFWSLLWFQLLTATLLHSFGNHFHLCRTESEWSPPHWAPSSSDSALGAFWEDAVAAMDTALWGWQILFVCWRSLLLFTHSPVLLVYRLVLLSQGILGTSSL